MGFSISRFLAILIKEFIQMRRDRLTFAMIIGIPLMQLILFGYAINMNPKNLPTSLQMADHSIFTRQIVQGLANTGYFDIKYYPKSEAETDDLLAQGKILFAIHIPPNFTDRFLRNQKPQILIEADATDPVASAYAFGAIQTLGPIVLNPLLQGPTANLQSPKNTIDVITHAKYNPEQITQYNIVPGLMGVVLTMTMVLITSMAIARERERGTMEQLLATPVLPSEVMLGKIIPYIILGYIQVCLILMAAHFLFQVPMLGSLFLLLILCFPFISANLAVGLTFSSLVKTQLQASQASFFFFLPSLLLSGFMFPFFGMPVWAQWLATLLPLTHFLRITRGILLKGNGFSLIWPDLWPILLFMIIALFIAINRYRQTLD
jgi:ABC-2 type transport system permease protein